MPCDPEVTKLLSAVLRLSPGAEGVPWEDWVERLRPFSIDQLAQLAIGMQDDRIVKPRQHPHALEALRTVVDAKLANQTHELMRKLDRATSRLQCVGIMVGVVGVGVMVLQLLVALKRIP